MSPELIYNGMILGCLCLLLFHFIFIGGMVGFFMITHRLNSTYYNTMPYSRMAFVILIGAILGVGQFFVYDAVMYDAVSNLDFIYLLLASYILNGGITTLLSEVLGLNTKYNSNTIDKQGTDWKFVWIVGVSFPIFTKVFIKNFDHVKYNKNIRYVYYT